MNKQEEKYFIIDRDALSAYGNSDGSTKEEAEQLLKESATEVGNLVVIKGVLIQPEFKL